MRCSKGKPLFTTREIVLQAVHRSGAAGISRRVLCKQGRFVLLFHGVSRAHHLDIPANAQPHLSAAELERIFAWLRDRFDFLHPQQLLTSTKPGILLTFDDGFANNVVNVLPLLAEYQAPAVFFVTTQHVLDPRDWLSSVKKRAGLWHPVEEEVAEALALDFYNGMTKEQVAELGDHPLITIGSHSVSHPLLTQCTDEQVEYELRESRRILAELTGSAVDLFAYPSGDYDNRVLETVRSCGYRAAFAVDPRCQGEPRLEIPRIGIYQCSLAYLSAKLSGLHRSALRCAYL
jgi:poly-beta-1,6-N-acetyl-D-glucosamine N-deacetylase